MSGGVDLASGTRNSFSVSDGGDGEAAHFSVSYSIVGAEYFRLQFGSL